MCLDASDRHWAGVRVRHAHDKPKASPNACSLPAMLVHKCKVAVSGSYGLLIVILAQISGAMSNDSMQKRFVR